MIRMWTSLVCIALVFALAASAAKVGEGQYTAFDVENQLRINTVADDINTEPKKAQALGKFNITVPVHVTPDGKQYMVDVQMGWDSNTSTAQISRLIIDTGSGDVVVFGEHHCKTSESPSSHTGGALPPCYDFHNSSSFKFNVEGLGRRTHSGCSPGLTGHTGALCRQALLIDGYKAEASCELAWEDLKFAHAPIDPLSAGTSDAVGVPDGITLPKDGFVRSDVCIVNNTRRPWHMLRYWNSTQGTIGMFYRLCNTGAGEGQCDPPFPPLLNTIPAQHRHVFSLDLNPPAQKSWMHFGAPEGGWTHVQWGETQPVPLMGRLASSAAWAFHTFELYKLSVCNTELLGNTSSHWPAMIDSGASCLSLPKELFESVVAWVPALDCVQEWIENFDYTERCRPEYTECTSLFKNLTMCYLRPGFDPADLPVLAFRLSEDGEQLYLPLSELVINDRPSGRPRVCVNFGDSIDSYLYIERTLYADPPRISFGTLALRNLLTIFDMEHTMVGMRNKAVFDTHNLKICSEPAVCIGAQQRYAPRNVCIDPPCDQLYFHVLDEETKKCRMGRGFLLSAVATLVAFAAAEIALSEVYERLARKLTNTI